MIGRAVGLATEHDVPSVVVGMAGPEGDRLFPEIVDFVQSALRIDDAILRITRERAVLFLTDADRKRAEKIMGRVLADFSERFATSSQPAVHFGYFEVRPGVPHLTVKDVLPELFAGAVASD